jgi:TM2 domain-containing membrane protein YozV
MELSLTGIAQLGLVVALALCGLVAAIRDPRRATFLVGLTFFLSTLGVLSIDKFRPSRTMLAPLQENRTLAVGIVSALILLMLLVHLARVRLKGVPGQVLLLLLIGLYAGFLRIYHEGPMEGLASIAYAMLTIPAMMLLIPSLVAEWSDMERLVRTVVYTMTAWSALVLVQVFVDREMLFASSGYRGGFRFAGFTANPQAASILLSVVSGVALWASVNTAKSRARAVSIVLTGAATIMLVWTGSRTGLLMLSIVAAAVFYSRVGRMIIFLPIILIVGNVLFTFATQVLDVNIALSRLATTEDTRTAVWGRLLETGLANPVFGVGVEFAEASENSYLYGLASYGVGMLGLLVIFVGTTVVLLFRLVRVRWDLPATHRPMVDLIIGFNLAYLAGSMFEGFMIARISALNVLMFMFAAMGSRVLEMTSEDSSLSVIDPEAEQSYGEPGERSTPYGCMP